MITVIKGDPARLAMLMPTTTANVGAVEFTTCARPGRHLKMDFSGATKVARWGQPSYRMSRRAG